MSLTWQPIESAPKDGEPLDLWVLHTELGRTFGRIEKDARWREDDEGEAWFSAGRFLLEWEGVDPDDGQPIHVRPTHWRRIPKTGPNGEKDGAFILNAGEPARG